MSAESDPSRGLLAPAAVRLVDINSDVDLDLSRETRPFRSALLVAMDGGRPRGSVSVAVDEGGVVPAEEIRARFAELRPVPAMPAAIPDASSKPSVSVVVTTCAQAESVGDTVESVLACQPAALEVIVVENRPVGSSVAAVLAERFGGDPRVRCIEEHQVGLSAARNAGLRAAVGDVVAFTDDDVLVERGWVGMLAGAFAAEPDAACVTGLILPQDLETPAQVLIEQFAGFGKGWDRRVYRLRAPTSALFPFAAGEFGSGACTALRRSTGIELGGFDTALGAGTRARGGEDLDIYVRILLAGHALIYDPGAILWHRHPAHDRHLRSELFGYGVGLSAMVTKQMLSGQAFAVLRRLPAAFAFLRDPVSRKNVRKGPEYPWYFDWIERLGLLAGPMSYVASRREQHRAPKRHVSAAAPSLVQPVDRVAWVGEVDLGHGLRDLETHRSPTQRAHDSARLLVRDGHVPLGLVTVPLTDGVAAADLIAAEIRHQVGERVDASPRAHHDRGMRTALSVVVCSRDRPESLERTLRSILATADPALLAEIIVVDNAPTSGATADCVAALGDDRVRYIIEPLAGLSRARNRGLAVVASDFVAFTDDDVVVDAQWLGALADGFARSPRVACVTGLVLAAELETPAQAYFESRVAWSSSFEPRLFDLANHRGDRGLYPYTAGEMGAGASFAVRRSALASIGLFDEALGAGSPARGGEDLDFFARVVLGGWTLAYEPSAIVWHTHRRDAASLRAQMYAYGTGLGAYAFKHLSRGALRNVLSRVARRPHALPGRRARRQSPSSRDHLGLRPLQAQGILRGPMLYLRGRRAARRRTPVTIPDLDRASSDEAGDGYTRQVGA